MDKVFVDAYLKMVHKDQNKIIKEDVAYDQLDWSNDDHHVEGGAKKTFENEYENGHLYCNFEADIITKEDGTEVINWTGDAYSDARDENMDVVIDGAVGGEYPIKDGDVFGSVSELYDKFLAAIDAIDINEGAYDEDGN